MNSSYSDSDPELAILIADIADDYRARVARGERPSAEEYVARHPKAADAIRGVLSVLELAVLPPSNDLQLAPEQRTTLSEGVPVRGGPNETLTEAGESESETLPILKGYTVLESLGRGGMGDVYRVRDALDREFALKLAKKAQLSKAGRDRFLDEAKAMARLDHPHVAPIHHYDLYEDRPYFLMRIFPASLADRMAEYQTDPKKAVRLMAAVAEGVGHLHARGFVHRDLKPQNILLDEHGQPAVSDFGLVKDVSDSSSGEVPPASVGSAASGETKPSGAKRSRTVAGTVIGTRTYMAPEQAAGLTHLASPKWDVWALGVILHQLLTGQYPKSSAAPERLLDPNEPDNPPPSTIKPGLNPKLDRIVRKCLARNEAERYADARTVAADLRRCAKRSPVRTLTLAIVVLFAATAFAALLLPRRNPIVAVDPIVAGREALARGKTVELIGRSGRPKWQHVAIGPASAIRSDDGVADSPTILDTNMSLFIDLFPDTGIDEYRFEAEFKSLGSPGSQVGLFVGRSVVPTNQGDFHTLVSLGFNDSAGEGPVGKTTGKWELWNREINEDEMGRHTHKGMVIRSRTYESPKADADGVWHSLAVDVNPTSFAWYMDGRPVGTSLCRPNEIDQVFFRRRLGLDAGRVEEFSPRSPLGIYVLSGIAHCRNARLISLVR